jgi:mannose-6-phosphate isomerase-like protein (cupin superfamily)
MLYSISSFVHAFAKVLECPDCKHEDKNPDEKNPKKELIKCPKCGEFMYEKVQAKTEASKLKGFVTDIEKDTVDNNNFRKVLYTGKNSQLVLMSLKPEEEIGEEVHEDTDQFFRVDDGEGVVVINGHETKIKNGSAIVVPQGAKHNVIAGKKELKIYSIYSPPHHEDGTIHKTKEEAEASEEEFDGKTTEGGTEETRGRD